MSPRETASAYGPRRSHVVPAQGGWSLRYAQDGLLASECFFLDEQAAHRASKRWELDGVEPRGATTLVGQPAVSAELIAEWTFERAAMALEARHV